VWPIRAFALGSGVSSTNVYTAVVATGNVLWQVHSKRRARTPDVEVKLSNAGLAFGPDLVWTSPSKWSTGGDKPVTVKGAGVRLQDGSGRTLAKFRPDAWDGIPGTVAPHDSAAVFLTHGLAEENGVDLTKGLVGFANLATGTVTCKPTALMSE
jgi:hypothetical protein